MPSTRLVSPCKACGKSFNRDKDHPFAILCPGCKRESNKAHGHYNRMTIRKPWLSMSQENLNADYDYVERQEPCQDVVIEHRVSKKNNAE
jgi:hypothetical protein